MQTWGMVNQWLQSPVAKVIFAGFESNTYQLQQAGWQISARQNYMHDGIQLALHLPSAKIYAITNIITSYYINQIFSNIYNGNYSKFIDEHLIFHVQTIGTDFQVQMINTEQSVSYFSQFEPIDCTPRYVTKCESIKDFKIFKPIAKSKDIIVGPQNVSEALDYILKLQDPKQQEIRDKKRQEEARQKVREELGDVNAKPDYEIHAQIITLTG